MDEFDTNDLFKELERRIKELDTADEAERLFDMTSDLHTMALQRLVTLEDEEDDAAE